MKKRYDNWVSRMNESIDYCLSKDGEIISELTIGRKLLTTELECIEYKIGYSLPTSYREVLLSFSSHVEFLWTLFDEIGKPELFKYIETGGIYWNIKDIYSFNSIMNDLNEISHQITDLEEKKLYQNKLPFFETGGGDYLAFDLSKGSDAPIIYLSHDNNEDNGLLIASNFIDYIDKVIDLGCVGPDIECFLPFMSSRNGGINPYSKNALDWKKFRGLSV